MGVVWLEELLPRYDYEHLAKLCNAVSIYIAGGEGNKGLHEFRTLIEDNVYADAVHPTDDEGYVRAPTRPGLGIELDEELIAVHAEESP
jgi:L-alanine-DL-glutamate epimerase-like enolase superfamily enzyme